MVGVEDRTSNQVAARPVADTATESLVGVVADAADGATVCTDEHRSDRPLASLGYAHSALAHSPREDVRGNVHANGIESLWSMFKRGYVGTYYQMPEVHMPPYVNESCGRHNIRPLDTVTQMGSIAGGLVGKRLRYDALITAE